MTCTYIKENGDSCNAQVMKDKSFCFFHAPETEEQRKLAVKNGGLASRKNNVSLQSRDIKDARGIIIVVEETINLLRAGQIHPNYSNSIFLGCNVLLKAQEQGEIEARLEEIEKKLDTTK